MNTSDINILWKSNDWIKSNIGHNKSKKIIKKLYSSVPRSTLLRLYRKLKFDYQLFGYDFNDVLTLAGYHNLTSAEESLSPLFHR